VVRAALGARLMTVLITDERTAEHALERADDP
jgi:DNA-binding transcriptional regulator LsrR (DeoR family)